MPSGAAHTTLAVVRGQHRRVRRDRQIEPQMHLLIHLLAFVDVTAHIGEFGLHLRIGQLQKRIGPQKFIGRLEAQIGQRLVVRAAHIPIDLEKARQQIARSARIDLIHNFVQKLVVDGQIAHPEFLRERS